MICVAIIFSFLWFVIIQLKTKNGFLAVPDPSIFIKNGFLAVPDPSIFIKNGFLAVPDPSIFIKNGFLAVPDPSVFIKNGFLTVPVPCGVSKRSFWLVQHSFIDHSFAALNSPAPVDRLGGWLVIVLIVSRCQMTTAQIYNIILRKGI